VARVLSTPWIREVFYSAFTSAFVDGSDHRGLYRVCDSDETNTFVSLRRLYILVTQEF